MKDFSGKTAFCFAIDRHALAVRERGQVVVCEHGAAVEPTQEPTVLQFHQVTLNGDPRRLNELLQVGKERTPFGREQVARHGDGWLPLTFDIDETRRSLESIHARMRELGRDPNALDVSLFFLADEMQPAEAIGRARDTGANRAILRLPVADEAGVMKTLDTYAGYLA